MSDLNIPELVALAKKATPSPWVWTTRFSKDPILIGDHGMRPIVLAASRSGMHGACITMRDRKLDIMLKASAENPDAAFIAAASPSVVLALCERVERAEKLLATIHKDADVYRQEDDGTRQWCPELNVYLRGSVGMLALLTPDEYAQLEQIAALRQPGEGG